jgi:hypothetical protein
VNTNGQKVENKIENANSQTTTVNNNVFATFTQTMFKIFSSKSKESQMVLISNRHCLPITSYIENEAQVYGMLKVYVIIIFFISIFQAYFMRLRSICAGSVYPKRDEERAVWLYNHILEIRSIRENSTTNKEATSIFIQFIKWLFIKISYILSNVLFMTMMHLFCWYNILLYLFINFLKSN